MRFRVTSPATQFRVIESSALIPVSFYMTTGYAKTYIPHTLCRDMRFVVFVVVFVRLFFESWFAVVTRAKRDSFISKQDACGETELAREGGLWTPDESPLARIR